MDQTRSNHWKKLVSLNICSRFSLILIFLFESRIIIFNEVNELHNKEFVVI